MRVSLDHAYQFCNTNYEPFISPDIALPDVTVSFKIKENMLHIPEKHVTFCTTCFYYDAVTKKTFQWDNTQLVNNDKNSRFWLSANEDWSEVEINAGTYKTPPFLERNFLLNLFSARLANFNGFIMHGSLVEHSGRSIIFTASSGVGKSTHSELWAKHFGDKIINGDKAILRYIDDAIYSYGSPWCGSSTYIANKKSPLAAIVVLEQAPENSIKKLNVLESLQYCTTHCFFPVWQDNLTDLCLDTLNEVLMRTPIYMLKCTPDKEAAELVRDTIFK